jgi:hypothetical protein
MRQARILVTTAVLCVGVLPASIDAGAPDQPPVPIPDRAHGAERVVVATVANTTASYERNRFGDELIVTRAQLAVEEALKGTPDAVILTVEGGTVNGMTMRVSDLPTLGRGERAVFFLTPGPGGEFKPHMRGLGILKLDGNTVRGSSLTVDEIRRVVRGAGK